MLGCRLYDNTFFIFVFAICHWTLSEKPTRPLQVISSPYTWVVPTQIKPLWPAWVSWLASIRFLQVVTCSQSSISILKQGQSLNKKVDDYAKKKRKCFHPMYQNVIRSIGCRLLLCTIAMNFSTPWILDFSLDYFSFFLQTGQTIEPIVHHMVSSNVDVKIFVMK